MSHWGWVPIERFLSLQFGGPGAFTPTESKPDVLGRQILDEMTAQEPLKACILGLKGACFNGDLHSSVLRFPNILRWAPLQHTCFRKSKHVCPPDSFKLSEIRCQNHQLNNIATFLKLDHRIICLLKFYDRQRSSEHHHVEHVVVLGYLSHILQYPACKIQYCAPESYRGSLLIPFFFSIFVLAHPCLRALPLPISASSCSVAPAASIAIDNLRARKCHSAQEPRIPSRP